MREPLAVAVAHLEACYPREGCGLWFERRGFVPIRNVAAAGATRYTMEPKEMLAALEVDDPLVAIVHSHPDAGAYFSAEDRDMALGGANEPLWPGVQYVVVSVRGGKAREARSFRWDAARADFVVEKVYENPGE